MSDKIEPTTTSTIENYNDERIQSPLLEVRHSISHVDEQLLNLLAERRELVRNVASMKTKHGIKLRDKVRENELLSQLIRLGKHKNLDSHFILDIFHRIIDDSLQVQEAFLQNIEQNQVSGDFKAAHLGEQGAYSYLAADKHFAHSHSGLTHVCCDEFSEIIEHVINGSADVGVLPIENTTSGGINEVYDLLIDCPLHIVGEETLKVEHCLISKGSSKLEDIDTVIAHPQARTQCLQQLKKMGINKVEYTNSTAHALALVQGDERTNIAALAGHEAAAIYQLQVIATDLADQKHNYSRFIVLSKEPQSVHASVPCKTSIMFATRQEPGALVDALAIFQEHALNLTKLESRPIIGNPWEEMFYIDLDGNQSEQNVAEAINALRNKCRTVKVLGSYPASERKQTQVNTSE